MPRRLHLLVIVALCVLSVTGAFAQGTEPCGCKDIAQIEYYRREATGAVEELKRELGSVGEFELNSDARYKTSQDNLKLKMDSLADASSLKPGNPGGEQARTSYTTEKGCHTDWRTPTFSPIDASNDPDGITEVWSLWPLTDCMKAALQAHEDVHMDVCQSLKKETMSGSWAFFKDRLEEEIEAYSAQQKYLEKQQRRLLCSCPYYSIRLEIQEDMGPAVETMRLFDSASPPRAYVDISLQPSPGVLTGEGAGAMKAAFRGNPNVVAHLIHPLKFQISADDSVKQRVHTTIQIELQDGGGLDLTTTRGPVTIHADSKTAGGETTTTVTDGKHRVSRHDVAKNSAFTSVMDFTDLNKPTVCPLPGFLNCHATLDVAEEYRTAKAANNRGSTVGEALWSIAGAGKTALASCH